MRTGDILIKILKDIAHRRFSSPDKQDELADAIDRIDGNMYEILSEWCELEVMRELSKGQKNVLSAIKDRYDSDTDDNFLDKDIAECPKFFSYDVEDEYWKKNVMPINIVESPYVTTSQFFWNDTWLKDIAKDSECWFSILRMWENITENTYDAQKFWEALNTRDKKYRIWIAVDGKVEKLNDDEYWSIYAFGYLKWITKNSFAIPKALTCEDIAIKDIVVYDPEIHYPQYFDIYNVLNEVHHAPDLLSRYLKVYQVIEQLAYRLKFRNIIVHAEDAKCSFVRELESLTDSFKETEKSVIISCIVNLFPSIHNDINNELGSDKLIKDSCKEEIARKFCVSVDRESKYTVESIADLVYKIRNSIVHNKETEFHLMFNNLDEYKAILPMITLLIKLLLKGIIENIEATGNVNKIFYKNPMLRLY